MMTWRVSWSDVLQPGGRLRGSMHSLARRYSSGVSILSGPDNINNIHGMYVICD